MQRVEGKVFLMEGTVSAKALWWDSLDCVRNGSKNLESLEAQTPRILDL